MAIDIQKEELLTFPEAARFLPGKVHISTVHRWRIRGIRDVKLETSLIGGIRYTSKQALQRFIDATTKAAERIPAPILDERSNPHKRSRRRRKQKDADRTLRRANVKAD